MPKLTSRQQEQLCRLQEMASKFVDLVQKKFDILLDYSEESLILADELLSLFFKEHRPHSDLATAVVGSYLGEVIIHNMGGRWELKDFSVVKFGKMRGVAYPLKEAKRRLTNGLEDSLVSYYLKLKLQFCHESELSGINGKVEKAHKKLQSQGWETLLLHRILSEKERRNVREEAASLLGKIGDRKAVSSLLKALNNPQTAYYAAIVFQGIPLPEAFPELLRLSKYSDSSETRIETIRALAEFKDERAVDDLVSMLSDEDEIISFHVSQALGKIGGGKVFQRLMEVFLGEIPGRKLYAIASFELIGDPRAIPYILEGIFDKDEDIREASIRACQYIPDERAVGPLLFSLKDKSSRIRTLAAYALVRIGTKKAQDPLKGLLKDPVESVREHASYLLPLLEAGKKPAGYCW